MALATREPDSAPGGIPRKRGPLASSRTDRSRPRSGWLLPLVLLVVAGTLRFYQLGYPPRIYFDETYYVRDANALLNRGVEEEFAVHPPVGKWLIGAGIAVAGNDSFGWRLAAAVAGTLTVLATYLIGLRLFRRRGVAALAAFLLAVDGLAFTMSRIAMLDVFLGLFVAAGVWLLLVDRDIQWLGVAYRDPSADRSLPLRPRWALWLAGLAFGLALATKWSALLAIAGAVLFVLASELLWRRRITGSVKPGWWRALAGAVAALLVVPLIIYVASYVGWFANFDATRPGGEACPEGACTASVPDVAAAWWGEQAEITNFHRTLEATHGYRSHPWTWLLLLRPVAYYYESCDDEKLTAGECVTDTDSVEEILGSGNPAIWWTALAALPLVAWFALRRREWAAATALGFLLIQYLPWLAVSRPNFLFYLTPALPFLCLCLALVAGRLGERPALRWLPAAVGALAVAGFVFWYPVYTGLEISRSAWMLRMWFSSWI